MNEKSRENVIEIRFLPFVKKLLVQWRAILLFGIAFGVLLAGARYMLDKRSYNPQDDAARADAVKKNLSSDQLGLVEEAAEYHKRIAALEDYFKSSAYIGIDPLDEQVVNIYYYISCPGDADANDILTLYRNYIGGSFAEDFRNETGTDIPVTYLKELITGAVGKTNETAESETAILNVRLSCPETVDVKEWTEAADKLVTEYDEFDTNSLLPSYKIEKAMEDSSRTVDTAMWTLQTTKLTTIRNFKTNLSSITTGFNDNQTFLYGYMIGDEVLMDNYKVPSPGVSKKMALLGFVAGVFIYGICLVFKLIFSPSVNGEVTDRNGNDTDNLGSLPVDLGKPWHSFLTRDGLVYRAMFGKELNKSSQIMNIVSRTDFLLKGEKEATFFAFDEESLKQDSLKDLVKYASEKGINIKLNVMNMDNLPEALAAVKGVKNAAVLPVCDATPISDYSDALNILAENNTNILGCVVLRQE